MKATSEAQYAAFCAHTIPQAEALPRGGLAIGLPMSAHGIPFSLCYVIPDSLGALHVVDPGTNTSENWGRFCAALTGWGYQPGDIASVTVTHLHHDHAGMTARIAASSDARVRMHESDARCLREGARYRDPETAEDLFDSWGVPTSRRDSLHRAVKRKISDVPAFAVDDLLSGGEVVQAPGLRWRIVATPGHTAGHIAVVDDAARALYSGDHVLPAIHPGVGLGERVTGDDPLQDYYDSLRITAEFDAYEVRPGHGFRFLGARARSDEIRAHHENRGREVAHVLTERPNQTVWEIAASLRWTGGFQRLANSPLLSALSQTTMHVERVRRGLVEGLDS